MRNTFEDLPEPTRSLVQEADERLHLLWSKSEGPRYEKREWQALERAIHALARGKV